MRSRSVQLVPTSNGTICGAMVLLTEWDNNKLISTEFPLTEEELAVTENKIAFNIKQSTSIIILFDT